MFCYWYCGFFGLICIRVWYKRDSSLQEYDRTDDTLRYWNMDCIGVFVLLMLLNDRRIYWVDQYMRQMRGSGIVAMEWRVAVQRHDGIEVRRNWMVTWLVIKAITVQRWHKRFGMIGVITLLYVVSRCNMDQVIMVYHYTIFLKWNVIIL